jgi:hypothetical protein
MKGNLRRSISPEDLRVPDDILQLNGQDILFVKNVNVYWCHIRQEDAWRHHVERIAAEALRTYVRTCSLFKSGDLSTNIKLTHYEALIRSVMAYDCPIWEHAANDHLLKLQDLQNRVLHAVGNLDKCTPVRELHVAFKIPYVYDYITKLCSTQAQK